MSAITKGDFTAESWPAYQEAMASVRSVAETYMQDLLKEGVATEVDLANLKGLFDKAADAGWTVNVSKPGELLHMVLRRADLPYTGSCTIIWVPLQHDKVLDMFLDDEVRSQYDEGYDASRCRRWGVTESADKRAYHEVKHAKFSVPVPLISDRDGVASVVRMQLDNSGVISYGTVNDEKAPEEKGYVRTFCEHCGGFVFPCDNGALVMQIECLDIRGRITKKLQEMAVGRYVTAGNRFRQYAEKLAAEN